jgi:hypothetical protein
MTKWRVVLIALTLGGCVSVGTSGGAGCGGYGYEAEPFDLREIREDPGPTLVSGVQGSFVYTPDGSEILYEVDKGTLLANLAIRGMTLADGARREVSDWPVAWSGERYALTADGDGLYYAAYDPETYGGAVLREAYSRANVALGGWVPYDVVASPDSAWLLVSATQGTSGAMWTLAFERATGAIVSTPCGGVAAAVFSPAGDELLCYRWNTDGTATTVRFSLQDQESQELPGVEACHGAFETAWWGSTGLRIACSSYGGDIIVGDPETASVDFSAHPESWHLGEVGPFSPDGVALAFVLEECLAGERDKGTGNIARCSRIEWQVHVVDLAASQVDLIASSGAVAGPMAFSSDGGTLTYLLGNAIHVRPTGP